MAMKKTALCLSISLIWLTGCNPDPVITLPTPSPTVTPTPGPTAPVFKGETTLKGKVAIEAQSVVIEAANATGTFRKATNVNNQNYSLAQVPVGERIRLISQYQNNPLVKLSALVDVPESQKELETIVNLDLESTALDLIYVRAAAQGRGVIVNTPVDSLKANALLTAYRSRVQAVLQEIFATPIDAITVNVSEAPKLIQTIDEVLPAIEAILQNQPIPSIAPSTAPTPTPVPSNTPTPGPTPSAAFTPTRLLIKPGESLTIAKDTPLKLWVAGVNDQNQQQAVNVIWTQQSATGQGNLGPDGVFSPGSAGTFIYQASLGSLSKSITITVTDADLKALKLVPDSALTLSTGQKFELRAEGTDEKGNTVTVTPTWELSNSFVASLDTNGVLIPLQPGRAEITARARSFSTSVSLTVESSSTFLIEAAPQNPTVLTGRTQPVQILALDAGNNTVGTAFNFSLSDPSIGSFLTQDTSVNGIIPTVVFKADKPGTTQVTVRDVISNQISTFPISVADNAPFIASFSPANAPLIPGQVITLNGENFSLNPNNNEILFNGIKANVVSSTANSMLVTVPVGAFTGFINISADGKRGNGIPFVISPRLDSIIPTSANEGDLVTITGQHFSTDNPAHNAVYFGSQRASNPINITSSSMQVRVPSSLTSKVNVAVRVKGQLSNFREFELAGASVPSWSEKLAAPSSRSGAKAERISGKIYVLGAYQNSSSDRLEVYNVTDNTWSVQASLPTERSRLATVVLDDLLYAIGGSGDANRLDRYDPDNNSWTQRANSDNSHVGAVAEAYRGKIYVIGGVGSDGRIVEEYNPDNDEWTLKRNSPSRRYDAASAVFNGKIYVIGGGEDDAEDRITAYDVEDDEWIVGLTPMPKKLRKITATVINNKIIIVGGEDQNGKESDGVYEYDPVANSWRTLRNLPSARSGAAVEALSSRVYVIGGENASGDNTNTNFRGDL